MITRVSADLGPAVGRSRGYRCALLSFSCRCRIWDPDLTLTLPGAVAPHLLLEGLLLCALLCLLCVSGSVCPGGWGAGAWALEFALPTCFFPGEAAECGLQFENHPLRAPSSLPLTWPKDKLKDTLNIMDESACGGTAETNIQDSSLLLIYVIFLLCLHPRGPEGVRLTV